MGEYLITSLENIFLIYIILSLSRLFFYIKKKKQLNSLKNTIYMIVLYTLFNCHNPTNNPKHLKTTFVGVVLLSVKKTTPPPHHHTGTDYN
jgi:hypothetical protein